MKQFTIEDHVSELEERIEWLESLIDRMNTTQQAMEKRLQRCERAASQINLHLMRED